MSSSPLTYNASLEEDPRIRSRKEFYDALPSVLSVEEPSPEAMRVAAQSFHAFVVDCLEYAGWGRQTLRFVAEMLDELPNNYSQARSGVLGRQRLFTWIGKWTILSSYESEIAIPLHICPPTPYSPVGRRSSHVKCATSHPSYRPPPRITNVEEAFPSKNAHTLQEAAQPSENTLPAQKIEQPSIPSRVELENGDVYEGRLYLVKRGA